MTAEEVYVQKKSEGGIKKKKHCILSKRRKYCSLFCLSEEIFFLNRRPSFLNFLNTNVYYKKKKWQCQHDGAASMTYAIYL